MNGSIPTLKDSVSEIIETPTSLDSCGVIANLWFLFLWWT